VQIKAKEAAMTEAEKGQKVMKEAEREIKDELQREVNKLIYQKQSENISAVREVSDKEERRLKAKMLNRDKFGLTSMHHMAAEATVRKMKAYLRFKKGIVSSQSFTSEEADGSRKSSSRNNMPGFN
jgi:hypothetical protein